MITGLLIGIGAVLPGISGGVIAVILNVYDKIIYSLCNLKKEVKSSIEFLLPLIFGALVGIVVSAKILKYLFNRYFIEFSYLLIGIILGSVLFLIKNIKNKCKKKLNTYLLIISFLISLLLSIITKEKVNLLTNINISNLSIIKLFLTGFIYISGKIIPGISSSFLLMIIGMYDYFLEFLSNPIQVISTDFISLVPLFLGMIVGIIVFVKLIEYLLKNFYSNTYSIIIGFVLGSIFTIFPYTISIEGILLLLIGFFISYKLFLIKK